MTTDIKTFSLPFGPVLMGGPWDLEKFTRRGECTNSFFLEVRSSIAETLVKVISLPAFNALYPNMDRLEKIGDGVWRIHRTYDDQCRQDIKALDHHCRSFGITEPYTTFVSSRKCSFQNLVDAAREKPASINGTVALPEGQWNLMVTEVDGEVCEVNLVRADLEKKKTGKTIAKKRATKKKATTSRRTAS